MSKDYKEMYLKEKMKRLNVEGELLIMKHERLMLAHESAKAELKVHLAEKELEKTPTKKTTKKKKS